MTEQYIPRTSVGVSVDGDGNGSVVVTVDPDHGPEIIGGLLASATLEALDILQLRGLSREDVVKRIMLGFQSIMEQQSQKIEIAQTVQ
jgi:hypothetical protein